MKKIMIFIIVVLVVILGIILVFRGINGEDNWIRDSKGVWIKHGNPVKTPYNVEKQQEALNCANNLYNNAKHGGMSFNSQCLGNCSDYSIDIIHVPRSSEDDKTENQCDYFRNQITHSFIELDKDANIVRVVD